MREVGLLLIVSLLCVAPAIAQSPTAIINGIVIDPSGAAIVGAQVVVVNDATGVQYITKTNGGGIYVVPNLPPGPYRIQVSNSGFKTIVKPDIVIHVQDALAINFTLPIGAASEIVTVQGGAPLVDTQNAAVSTVIDRNFVEQLPLNGRSFNTLLQLTPGVVIATSNNNSPGQFSIAGQRTDANSFTIDGVSANFGVSNPGSPGESGTGGAQALSALGGTSSLVSVDALQEFRIETSSVAPEFGRTPGGQVILTTRSGTNDFHGGIFDYFRNTVMDANNWFSNATINPVTQKTIPRAPEHHNDFGGSLGGPLWKSRTFFFLSYEGARLDLPQTAPVLVPSAYARTQATANAPTVAPFLNAYPQPDDKTIRPGVFTSPFAGSYSNRGTLDAGSIRIDHTLNDRFTLFARYNDAPSEIAQRGSGFSLSDLGFTAFDTQTFTVGLNMLLSSRISNTLRGNYSRQSSGLSFKLDSFGGAVPLDPSLLLSSLSAAKNVGLFEIGDLDTVLSVGSYGGTKTRQANFTDDLTSTVGAHQIKFGGDYRAIFLDASNVQHIPLYIAQGTQSLINTKSVFLLSGATYNPSQFLAQSLSLYAQDTWKATPRLTLTYGLRWELSPAPSARGTTKLTAWQNVANPAQISPAPQGTPLWATTYDNFAPRFGLAYSLTSKGDFVLRAGAGIFYDLGVGNSDSLSGAFPNHASQNNFSVSVPVADLTPYLATISLQPPYPGDVVGFFSNIKLPRSYQWNVALEKSFGGRQVLTATYVAQAGRDLLRQEALYKPNGNFSGDFRVTLNDARSNYNALQVQYRRPLASRLQALLNYTWSHSLDNASNDFVSALSNTVISAASDYASSNFDVRQTFSGALSYDVPKAAKPRPFALLTKDWSVQTVIVARTGFPYNGVLLFGTSPDLGGNARTRPDRLAGQPLYLYGSQCAAQQGAPCPGGKALNMAAFSVPTSRRQGTEGRNDIPGFGLTQVDLSLARKFAMAERHNLQVRADAFNLFNHPNFLNPGAFIQSGTFYLQSHFMLNQGLGGLNPLFQEGGPRSLQLSLKMTF